MHSCGIKSSEMLCKKSSSKELSFVLDVVRKNYLYRPSCIFSTQFYDSLLQNLQKVFRVKETESVDK